MTGNLHFEDVKEKGTKGFVSSYMHFGRPKMIWVDEANKQGYLDRSALAPIQEFHLKNLIVDRASILVAKRMRPGTTWGAGITHLEIGTGVGTGSTQTPQPENANAIKLREPFFRKAIGAWSYIDASGNPTASETNIIEFTINFTESEANGSIVEMGLFGGDASTSLSSGYMFNYKVFPVWNKQEGMQLTVTWRITF